MHSFPNEGSICIFVIGFGNIYIGYIYKLEINCAQQDDENCEEEKKDLRSRGLCLVPVSCTLDVGVDVVAGSADFWAASAAPFGLGFGG